MKNNHHPVEMQSSGSMIAELPYGCPLMDNFDEYKLAALGIFSVDDCIESKCKAAKKICGDCACPDCCHQQGSI